MQFLKHRIAPNDINARDLVGRSSVDRRLSGGLNQTTLTTNFSSSHSELSIESPQGAKRHDAAQQPEKDRSTANGRQIQGKLGGDGIDDDNEDKSFCLYVVATNLENFFVWRGDW